MRCRSRVLVTAAIVMAVGMAFVPLASAAPSLVTFTTSSTGSRTVTAAVAPTFPTQDLSLSGGNVVTTVPASTTLTEVFATGSTWSVKAEMCGPDNYTTPTAPDCTNLADRMMRATGTSNADAILGATISLQRGTPTITGVPAGTAAAGSETDLGSTVTLLSSSNEVASTTYNGVYAVTTGLTVNNLTRTGTWKGYWIITQTT